MRGFLFLLALATLTGFSARAQTPTLAPEPAVLVGTYRLTYQPDSTNPAKRLDILCLLLGKTLSQFTSRATLAGDSLLAVFAAQPFNQDNLSLMSGQLMKLPYSRFRYSVYKTVASQHLYYDNIGISRYRYEEPASFLTWTITPTTASIAGYACQRATTTFGGRTWEAWFTRAVPLADGPYKFYGLPGLIVKVGDTRQHYVFELAQLTKPTTECFVAPPTKAPTSTDRTTFRRVLAEYNADPIGHMSPAANGGAGFIVAGKDLPDAQQRARENARKRNNPLELH